MTTTNTATIKSLTEALQNAFELQGSDWNGAEEKSIDFSSADSIENLGDASAFQQWKDGLKNAKSALAKAIPHIVSAAEKSGNDGYIFFNIPKHESDDETAAQDVSDALMALIRACDQSDAELAEEICQFIDEIEQSAAGGHTIASGWNHGTKPEDIELADVVNALDLGLEACSDESNSRTDLQHEKAAFYLGIFRTKSSIAELVAENFAADMKESLPKTEAYRYFSEVTALSAVEGQMLLEKNANSIFEDYENGRTVYIFDDESCASVKDGVISEMSKEDAEAYV